MVTWVQRKLLPSFARELEQRLRTMPPERVRDVALVLFGAPVKQTLGARAAVALNIVESFRGAVRKPGADVGRELRHVLVQLATYSDPHFRAVPQDEEARFYVRKYRPLRVVAWFALRTGALEADAADFRLLHSRDRIDKRVLREANRLGKAIRRASRK